MLLRRKKLKATQVGRKKNGFFSVCPPEDILKNTVTIRIHLDDADEFNGALKVIPGSHNKKLSDTEIQLITQNSLAYDSANVKSY
jgi:hypothetical protein